MALSFDMIIGNCYRRHFDANRIFTLIEISRRGGCGCCCCRRRRQHCRAIICYCFRLLLLADNCRFCFLKITLRNCRELFTAPRTATEARKNAVLELKLSIKVFAARTHAGLHEGLFKVVTGVGEREKGKDKKLIYAKGKDL